MNAYDFDKTIYDGDSTADFYMFCLKKHKSIILLAPSLLCAFCKFYVFKIGTKTEFKEKMYRFLTKCNAEKDVAEFWDKNCGKIKEFYINQKKSDDVIISASPVTANSPSDAERKRLSPAFISYSVPRAVILPLPERTRIETKLSLSAQNIFSPCRLYLFTLK